MSNLQIKNVPDELHEELRRRAALRRLTVRDYVLELIAADQARPTVGEWLAEIRATPPLAELDAGEAARMVREGREEREQTVAAAVGRSA